MNSLLSARAIGKWYGASHALTSASLEIHPGEVQALVGENGAGKSTLSRILCGAVQPDSGQIYVQDKPVSFRRTSDAQEMGIGIVQQELDLFPNLSVAENIVIGNLQCPAHRSMRREDLEAFCAPHLTRIGLSVSPHALLGGLPIAQQQLVAIARALSMRCRILFLDEPTSALSDHAAERLFQVISALSAQGTAIVYVSHKMDEVFRLCSRITVMRDGETIGTQHRSTTKRAEIIQMMVGRRLDLSSRPVRVRTPVIALSAIRLTTQKLKGVSFDLHRGEVLGIAGLVGAGRSELGAALVGLDPMLGGSWRLRSEPFAPKGPAHARRHGVVLLPEDRKLQGLMPQMSVMENTTLSVLGTLARWGFLRKKAERLAFQPLTERLHIKTHAPELAISTLSGGNQQKALLGRCLLADPDVLFLDDPARGIDVAAKEDVYELIDELASKGKSILLASSELPELLRCCDRIMVLNEGAIVQVFDAHQATQEAIMAAATQPVLAQGH